MAGAVARLGICSALFICVAFGNTAQARPWKIKPGLVTESVEARLHRRHRDIKTPRDLQNLLQDIGRRSPALHLHATKRNDGWYVDGSLAPLITDIEVELVLRYLRRQVLAVLHKYVGQVDSPEIRTKMKAVATAYLKRRGFPNATISFETERSDSGVYHLIDIDEGEPCVIERIEFGFQIPDEIEFDLQPGVICDREDLQSAMDELETDLREFGYNQVRLELAGISAMKDKNAAVVYISGVLGQRVRYEIRDSSHRFLIDDLFVDEELTAVDPTIVGPEAMKAELARRYRNKGFIDVQVRGPKVQRSAEGAFVYTYDIDPGSQYELAELRFEGTTVFTQDELLDMIDLTGLWQQRRPLNKERVQEGLQVIRAKYQERGFWDAKVRNPTEQKDRESSTVRMTVQINEGLPRILSRIIINGNHAVPDDELQELLGIEPGQPIDRAELFTFHQKVREIYISRGYMYVDAKIDLRANEMRQSVQTAVIVTVTEGPRVRIGEVSITGLAKTHPKVVRRELLFASGDWYNPEKIGESRRALTRLGLFHSVQIRPADSHALTEQDEELDLVIDLREGRAGNVSFGPGLSLFRGWRYKTEASYNNIGGVGRQVSLRSSISEEKNQEAIGRKTLVGRKIGIGYLEPYLFNYPIDAAISLTHRAQADQSVWNLSYEGEIKFPHRLRVWLPGSVIAPFYGQKIARSEGEQEIERDLIADDVRVGRVGVRYHLDERDDAGFPTTGFLFETELAWARYSLGGDLRYFRWNVVTSQYLGFLTDWVLALGVSLTAIDGIERKGTITDILPFSERLALGGSGSIRGYRPGTLGPIVLSPNRALVENAEGVQREAWDCGFDNQGEVGGNRRVVIKSELRYRWTPNFGTAGFIDSGAVFFSSDQMERFGEVYASDPLLGPSADEQKLEGGSSRCLGAAGTRRIEENVGYEFQELLANPGFAVSRHYLTYGTALSYLTPVGPLKLAYGLPWREPQTKACQQDEDFCFPRAKQSGHWLLRGQVHLNISAEF